ncbi:MAG: hypothetical protein CMH64_02420 [Nanoarchaeota archaeon]|nr:hypothetical protein [Nanoarchaeota archaeon]|tara:strand:+ start:38 stop:343 length:306 start_codon:yes stop_codon:yes gene_type:complete
MKKLDLKKKLLGKKFLIYILITVIAIVVWATLFNLIKWLAVIYFAFRFVKLALRGFSCPTCWFHTIIAALVVILTYIVSSKLFIVFFVIFIWADFFFGEKN